MIILQLLSWHRGRQEDLQQYSQINPVPSVFKSGRGGNYFYRYNVNWTILQPIHILWVNLVTDTLPALALGVEKAEEDIMKQKPRNSKSSFFSEGVGISILYQGICKGIITLAVFYAGTELYSQEIAMTMAFATLGLIQIAHSLNVRSNKKSLFKMGLLSNKYLFAAIIISAFMQLFVIIIPCFISIFKVKWLNFEQWIIVLIASIAIIPIVEIGKIITRVMFENEKKI
jgi:Ca2+-transporting ATPase